MNLALWTLVFLIVGGFVGLGAGSFIGTWLGNIRRGTTTPFKDSDATYGEPDPTHGRGGDVFGRRG